MNSIWITLIGLTAQGFFSARSIVQWLMSEKARRVLSPTLFWVFSVAGACLLGTYGYLRRDFAVMLGQFCTFYVYIWNLKAKKVRMPVWGYVALCLLPVFAVYGMTRDFGQFIHDFFQRSDVPMWMVVFGVVGQVLFTLRFIYQWYYSSRIGRSELPAGFWWISLIGALLILSYGIMRLDIVVILGQGFGLLVYGRNLWIGYHEKPGDDVAAKGKKQPET